MTLALIVDDSEVNRKLERDLLRSAGFETLETGRGAAVALVPYWILDGEESVARIGESLAPGCVLGFHVARGEEESAREWLAERAPEALLLTEPSTLSITDCARVSG